MIKEKTFLGIIVARGGSKEIPNKNIVYLNGYPLIYYIIKAAKNSNIFDNIIVSTDSKKIKIISEKYGIWVPFLRPANLSNDTAVVNNVLLHALKYIEKNDKIYDYICVLQPTSPLFISDDLLNMVTLLFKKKADMIVSVGKSPINVNWARKITKNLSMKNFNKNIYGTNRQHYENMYFLNGAAYMGKWSIFYNKKDYYKQNTYAYIMPYERSIDIDNYFDLKLAEFIMKENI